MQYISGNSADTTNTKKENMIIRQIPPHNSWTKFDNKVFLMDISAGAKVLYGYLCSLQPGTALKSEKLAKNLRIKTRTLHNYEKELKDKGLLLIKQVQPRIYMAYVGHTSKTAEEVMRECDKEDML